MDYCTLGASELSSPIWQSSGRKGGSLQRILPVLRSCKWEATLPSGCHHLPVLHTCIQSSKVMLLLAMVLLAWQRRKWRGALPRVNLSVGLLTASKSQRRTFSHRSCLCGRKAVTCDLSLRCSTSINWPGLGWIQVCRPQVFTLCASRPHWREFP